MVTEVRNVTVVGDQIILPNIPKQIMGSTLYYRTIDNEELDVISTRINKSQGMITLKLSPTQVSSWKANLLQVFYGTCSCAFILVTDSVIADNRIKKVNSQVGLQCSF